MNAANTPVFRFSDVVYAIGTTPKALRNWLQRDQVRLPGEHSGGWREFTHADVAVLALVRSLVNFGIKIEQADEVAHQALKMFPQSGAVAAVWSNRSLVIYTDAADGWNLKIVDHWRYGEPSKLADALRPTGAAVVLDLESILRTAFARATESASDGAIDDE